MVATGYNSDKSLVSTNGVLWTEHSASSWLGATLKWVPQLGKFVVFNSDTPSVSIDGKNWVVGSPIAPPQPGVVDAYVVGLEWSPTRNKLIGVRNVYTYPPPLGFECIASLVESSDGLNWTTLVEFSDPHLYISAVVWSPESSSFLAVGYDAVVEPYPWIVKTSNDGVNWTAVPVLPGVADYYTNVVYAPALSAVVCVGGNYDPEYPFYIFTAE